MNQRRAIALVVILYGAMLLMLLYPLLCAGKTTFIADITYNNEPAANFINEFWRNSNKFPLWNPWVLNGVPQVAVNWPMVYFPSAIGLGAPFGLGTGLFMFTHLLLAGLGGFFWQLKSFRFQPANFMSATFFGLVYMLCGYMFGCPINLFLMASAAYIPFTLLTLDIICSSPKWWHCGVLAFLFGLQFSAGRPEMSAAACFLYLVYFLSTIGSLRPRAPFMVAVALALGAGYAAFGYIPLAELVANSPSALQFSVLKSSYWSAGLLDWLTVLLTQPFGHISMLTSNRFVTYPGAFPYLTSLFVGAPVLTLAALSLPKNFRQSVPWMVLVALAVLISAGQFGPFGQLIDSQNVVRYPIKLAVFALFGLIAMAANGWRSVFSDKATKSNILGMVFFWLTVVVTASVVGGHATVPEEHALAQAIVLGGLSGLITGVLLIVRNRFTELILMAVIAAGLYTNNRSLLEPLAANAFYNDQSTVAETIKNHCQIGVKNFRVLPLIDNSLVPPVVEEGTRPGDLERNFSAYCRQILRPNTTIDAHLQSTNGISIIPTWNSLFLDAGLLPRSSLTSVVHPLGKSDVPLYRYCQATSTAYVETPIETLSADGNLTKVPTLDPHFFSVLKEDERLNVRLYAIVHIRPRVSVIQNIKYVSTREEALKYINRADANEFDPTRQVTIVGAEVASSSLVDQTKPPTKNLSNYAEVEIDNNEYIRINANTAARSALVLTDGYYPGWEAFDNGKQTQIYIADGVMRAVMLEPGEHRIVFRYRPTSWTIGLLLFFVSTTTALFMLLSRFVKTNPSW